MKKVLDDIKKLYGIDKDKVLSVSQISDYIKNKLNEDNNLTQKYIHGETTNVSKPSSGHIYFDIKDEKSLLRCTFFRGSNGNLPFEIENGLDVLVLGSVTTYEKKSNYQLNVTLIFPIGEGAFHLRFKQLKKKLTEEGLFDEKYKKEIPALPKSIGLITAKRGSTIKDVLKVLEDRCPHLNVKLISTSMQGDKASKEIIQAINILNKIKEVETILIIRGGGSIEDLVCFNDEDLARVIFKSKKPIISGVGHETDFTITDFVADKRASTPSVAAKMVITDKQELLDKIEILRAELEKSYSNTLESIIKKINNWLEYLQSLDNEFKKSYSNYLKVKERDETTKKYKVIIAILVVLIILYFIIKSMIGG
jgi:exodeoxyribonuclease VII large subunit